MRKKKNTDSIKAIDVTRGFLRCITSFYVLTLFIALPLFYHNKYYDIGKFKFSLYEKITLIFIILSSLIGIVHIICLLTQKQKDKTKLSIIDWFAIGYAIIVILCYFMSSYKEIALHGYQGWNMGLLSQLSFVILYFLVSRFWNRKWMYDFLFTMCISSALTFIFAILHRFLIDPLALYQDIDTHYHLLFLSTIGQATWYSSFLCTVFPIGLFLFWYCNQKWQRICLLIYCILGYASLVTQNSDSAFAALAATWLTIFFISFDSNQGVKRFLEIVILGLITMRFVGLLQLAFPDHIVELDTLSIFFSQHYSLWILLALLFIIYALFTWGEQKKHLQVHSILCLRYIVAVLLIIGFILTIILIVLTTKRKLPDFMTFLYQVPYLSFNQKWGNQRGFTWQLSLKMFMEYPIKEKILGIGPDCYSSYAYAYYSDEIRQVFGDSVLTNAHNEWLNILLNEGILGLLSYLGFFLSAAFTFLKKRYRHALLPAIAVCIFSYLFHNMFCYQQVMCTPFIFILIGMGGCYLSDD